MDGEGRGYLMQCVREASGVIYRGYELLGCLAIEAGL